MSGAERDTKNLVEGPTTLWWSNFVAGLCQETRNRILDDLRVSKIDLELCKPLDPQDRVIWGVWNEVQFLMTDDSGIPEDLK